MPQQRPHSRARAAARPSSARSIRSCPRTPGTGPWKGWRRPARPAVLRFGVVRAHLRPAQSQQAQLGTVTCSPGRQGAMASLIRRRRRPWWRGVAGPSGSQIQRLSCSAVIGRSPTGRLAFHNGSEAPPSTVAAVLAATSLAALVSWAARGRSSSRSTLASAASMHDTVTSSALSSPRSRRYTPDAASHAATPVSRRPSPSPCGCPTPGGGGAGFARRRLAQAYPGSWASCAADCRAARASLGPHLPHSPAATLPATRRRPRRGARAAATGGSCPPAAAWPGRRGIARQSRCRPCPPPRRVAPRSRSSRASPRHPTPQRQQHPLMTPRLRAREPQPSAT